MEVLQVQNIPLAIFNQAQAGREEGEVGMRLRFWISREDYAKQFDEWKRWFAWYPAFVDGEMIWLEWVEWKLEASWHEVFTRYRKPTPSSEGGA